MEDEAGFVSGNRATHEEDVCVERDPLTLTFSQICRHHIRTPSTANHTLKTSKVPKKVKKNKFNSQYF